MSDYLRSKLQEAMKKPTSRAINGSYQDAVNYKKNYAKAANVLKKKAATEQQLIEAINLMTE